MFDEQDIRARVEADARQIAESLPRPRPERHAGMLTKKEALILKMVGAGMSNREISDTLGISPLTARCHLKHIHDKCAIPGRCRLAAVAARVV